MSNYSYLGVDVMEKVFAIKNLDCAHCGAKIEEAINRMDGVESAVLNFPMRKIKIIGNINDEFIDLMNEVADKLEPGVKIVSLDKLKTSDELYHNHEHTHQHCDDECRNQTEKKRLTAGLMPVIIGSAFFAAAIVSGKMLNIFPLTLGLFAAAYIVLGKNILKTTARNMKSMKFFDENTLMTVATMGAFAIGEYAEAVGVVLFFRIGEMFEDFAVARSRKAITEAAGLKVEEADILIDGEFLRKPSGDIKVGDIIRVKKGERIAADGIIESGESQLDTSALNGEPVPMTVRSGDSVMSGCINLANPFTLRTTAAAADSMISKIAQAVEDASAGKPKIDRFITRFAKIYTPIVIAAAALTAVIPSLISGHWSRWIHSALTFLVISCPCALVLSVPLAYFSGIGAASKLGILFKGGDSVEALGKVKAIAFDKTGTLTNGSFTVTDVKSFCMLDENELLKLCASCEQISSHPIAESILMRCRELDIKLESPEKSEELAGRGIIANLGGCEILCGNERLMNEKGMKLPEGLKNKSGSVVYVAVDGKIEGRIIVSDSLKRTTIEAVRSLKAMGIKTAMLTGDKSENAEITAGELGIDYVKGELMPDGKLSELENIRKSFGEVMFVGDGINDGPVLAGADVGGAMQTGADLALEAADVVLINSEPESVVRAKKIADKALRVSYQNIIFALVVKAAVLVLGLLGHPNMWLAVFADSGTAMLLILNSIRLLNTKKIKS